MISPALTIIVALAWLLIGVGCWLGWQLLRQNGRILLRLDELEKRLDELEFGEPNEPRSLSDNETADQVNARLHPNPLPQGEGETQDRTSRFGNRSVTRSRIKRDGLEVGTPAPDFHLPRLDGRGELSLGELRGQRVLLVFSDPHCGPCNALAPELEKFHRTALTREPEVGRVTPWAPQSDETFQNGAHGVTRPTLTSLPAVLMISCGEPKDNRAKVKEHGLTFPIVLQQRWEISRRYALFATPVAYLIDEAGIISHDVAVGVEPILELISRTTNPVRELATAVDSPDAVKSVTL